MNGNSTAFAAFYPQQPAAQAAPEGDGEEGQPAEPAEPAEPSEPAGPPKLVVKIAQVGGKAAWAGRLAWGWARLSAWKLSTSTVASQGRHCGPAGRSIPWQTRSPPFHSTPHPTHQPLHCAAAELGQDAAPRRAPPGVDAAVLWRPCWGAAAQHAAPRPAPGGGLHGRAPSPPGGRLRLRRTPCRG